MNLLVCVIDPTIELLLKNISHLAASIVDLPPTCSALFSWCLPSAAAGMLRLSGGQHRH
jgi:hypothetical protein